MTYTIVIDATAVHEQSGGAGTYLRALVSALSDRGHPPIVIARRNDLQAWMGAEEVMRIAPTRRPFRMLWEHVGLGRALARRIPHGTVVLHSPHYTSPVSLPRRVRRVVTIHDLTFFTRPGDHSLPKRLFFTHAIRSSVGRADAIIAVSDATASQYLAITGRSERVFTALHGVDHTTFKPYGPADTHLMSADATLLAEAGVVGCFVAFLGTIEPRKQVPLLLRAYGSVKSRNSDVGLVLAGQQWPGYSLPPAQPGEIRLGYVSDALAAALLRSAAVVVYPSADEGFGLPLVEAMASGAPVVAARSPVSLEVCGDAAQLVDLDPPGQFSERLGVAIIDALDPARREQRSQAGIQRSSQFSWDKSAAAHLLAYEAAAERAPVEQAPAGS